MMHMYPGVTQVALTVRLWHDHDQVQFYVTVSQGNTAEDLDDECSYDDSMHPGTALGQEALAGFVVFSEILRQLSGPFGAPPDEALTAGVAVLHDLRRPA